MSQAVSVHTVGLSALIIELTVIIQPIAYVHTPLDTGVDLIYDWNVIAALRASADMLTIDLTLQYLFSLSWYAAKEI